MHCRLHRITRPASGKLARHPASCSMPPHVKLSIVNVGYRSTNFWIVSAGTSRLIVDLGWPNTWQTMTSGLARMDVPLRELRFGLATHYHIDHAGLAQEFKRAGVPLLVVDLQQEWIPRINDNVKPADHFTDITLHDNRVITLDDSRGVLASIGIAGQIVHTPGHSHDSVSLLLDGGEVFTGDLTHPMFVTEEESVTTNASWQRLRDRGATSVYPGHGPIRPMPS